MFQVKKRSIKFLTIFLIFLTIALVMPSVVFLYTGEDSVRSEVFGLFIRFRNEAFAPEKHEPEPETEPTPTSTPAPTPTPAPAPPPTPEPTPTPTPEPTPDPIVTIKISAAGDVTLGGCETASSYRNFMREFEVNDSDYAHFFRNVKHIFDEDDLTLVNFEGVLTELTKGRRDQFNFRGPPDFAKILSAGSINAVSLANNHSNDFLARGISDTVEHLSAEGIAYFGNEFNTILEINGINVGLFGFLTWGDTAPHKRSIKASLDYLQDNGAELIIAYFHWGSELHTTPSAGQRELGRFSIDNGAHLVLGAHPHVIQGIEEYNGRNIVYSLANFSFGGNRNPASLDSFIFQQTFTFDSGLLLDTNETNIIPVRTTSARNYNNYQPTPAEGTDAERIMEKIKQLSEALID
jgi:poly-gamma-glutamate synthesis protein (capsule biosynthesis protein)